MKKFNYLLILVVFFAGLALLACEYNSNGDDDDSGSVDESVDDDDLADDDSESDDDSVGNDDDSNQPPPEAYEACEGKQTGDDCEFEDLNGTATGTCQDLDGDLVCMPETLPDDDDDDTGPPVDDDDDDMTGPPEEAIDACDGKSEGDDCEFESQQGDTITGTCQMIGEVLACAPEGGLPE